MEKQQDRNEYGEENDKGTKTNDIGKMIDNGTPEDTAKRKNKQKKDAAKRRESIQRNTDEE